MGAFIDETGNRYGHWFVLSRAEEDKGRSAAWVCRCDCGIVKAVKGDSLRHGRSKSCGCLHLNIISLPRGEAAFNSVFRNARRRADRFGREWKLTKDQVAFLTSQNCYYCGRSPSHSMDEKRHNGSYIYNGLDRVDNTGGYTIENVVPCCGTCNIAKRATSLNEFRDWIAKAYNHLWQEEYA